MIGLKTIHHQPKGGGTDKQPDDMTNMEMIAPINAEHGDKGDNITDNDDFSPNIQTQQIHSVSPRKGLRKHRNPFVFHSQQTYWIGPFFLAGTTVPVTTFFLAGAFFLAGFFFTLSSLP